MKYDCLVLGAGIVGISTALHLQQRGCSVVLIDRRPAAEETSYGNAGLIQTEGVMPYSFPRDLAKIIAVILNRTTEAQVIWRSLLNILPWIVQYWRQGRAERVLVTARATAPLVARALLEHEALMDAVGISADLRRDGYLILYRDHAQLERDLSTQQQVANDFSIPYEALDRTALLDLEPHLINTELVGAVYMTEPVLVPDPGDIGKAYAKLFMQRGGTFETADARTLAAADGGWQVRTGSGPLSARNTVIALGPWSDVILKTTGITVPLGVKRGYHMHYRARGDAALTRPVVDKAHGYVLTPNRRGLRLTTGAEFAHRDTPPTPVQLAKVEPIARGVFPLAARTDAAPWLGSRPCLPDLLPVIGSVPGHPGLWANFGHHHLGFTLGPATGRLLAEIILGETPFTDPTPYRIERF